MNATPPGVKGGARRPSVGFQFVAVPAQLLRAGDLSFGAVVLLGVVADAARQNRSGLCKLANATLAERIGRSESEVGRYLLELESAGLARREFGRSKHVRLGVRVTWAEPVPDVPGTSSVQVPRLQEPGPWTPGIAVPDVPGPIQNLPQNPSQTGPILPNGEEDPESRVPDGPTAARLLRAMIAKGRERQAARPDAPVSAAGPVFAHARKTSPPSGPRQDSPRREVARMIDQLAVNFTASRSGPRRLSPQQLARQLAEVRRRHGAGGRLE